MSNNQVQKYQAIQYFQCAKISPLIIPQTPIVLPSKQSPVLQTGLSSNKHRKGFTILEVLISISILVLTLMVLYQSFSTSLF
ncbi:MAG: prepilin-type N-terminal cleavage/methylation domain-containing protein, partial [SAR324 cluster bacterium]|nr:prepilin-type N-terminal cleavage/methylation domain-containing protein [SAR324 cluster bacterium]